MIEPLSRETALAVSINFGESAGISSLIPIKLRAELNIMGVEWQRICLKPAVMDIVARISSRIYLGEQLCRNDDWLRITTNYTACFYTASTKLRMFPRYIRFLAHWFLPECRILRQERDHARKIIMPLIERRRELRRSELAAGKTPTYYADSIDWAEQEAAIAGSLFDPVIFQLTLSLLAIHTTFDLLQQTMMELGRKPEFLKPLRDEVKQILKTEGWKKTSIFKLKLLDSAVKEAQRLKPGSLGSLISLSL